MCTSIIFVLYYIYMFISGLIEVASFLLPFFNEVANILTSSGIPIFKNLYVTCIYPSMIPANVRKYVSDCLCTPQKNLSHMIIDIIALIGIILNIVKNSVQYNYTVGVLTGISIVLTSFILPNMFLHSSIDKIKHILQLRSKKSHILIGLSLVILLLIISYIIEKFVQSRLYNWIIDPEYERKPVLHANPLFELKKGL